MILNRVLSLEFASSLIITLIIFFLWRSNPKDSNKASSGIAVNETPQRSTVHLKPVRQNDMNVTTISWVLEELRAERADDTDYVLQEEALELKETAAHEYMVKRKPPSLSTNLSSHLPWFTSKDKSARNASLLSCGSGCEADRIIKQLQFIPDNVSEKSKKICVKNWPEREMVYRFEDLNCPVSSCRVAQNCDEEKADAIVFRDRALKTLPEKHPPKQVWILFTLESPASPVFFDLYWKNIQVNWTASYNRESDIVTPYGYWVNYKDSEMNHSNISRKINYAENKTRQVAWIVSHCLSPNYRERYVEELKKYIEVDIYGACGTTYNATKCPLEQYKFYLAFENSNCKDYITEKLFLNGFGHNVLPIVMGARPEDYARVAPPHSYIHVDEFESPRDLADYLTLLDTDDQLYNSYFQWKGTGEFLNTSLWCRLCALLHADYPAKWHDVNKWLLNRFKSCFNTSLPITIPDPHNIVFRDWLSKG